MKDVEVCSTGAIEFGGDVDSSIYGRGFFNCNGK